MSRITAGACRRSGGALNFRAAGGPAGFLTVAGRKGELKTCLGGVKMTQNFDSLPAEMQKKRYDQLVQRVKPRPPVARNTFWAFLVGGLISVVGQVFFNIYQGLGLPRLEAGAAMSMTLVFFAALLTGLGIYDEIAKIGGAGTIVPITGFANSMVAPAMEFKTEGLVLGVGARLFTVAGPVLVFGIVTAWFIGLLYFFFR